MPNWGGGGGGSEGSLAKDQTFSGFSFVHPSLKETFKEQMRGRLGSVADTEIVLLEIDFETMRV